MNRTPRPDPAAWSRQLEAAERRALALRRAAIDAAIDGAVHALARLGSAIARLPGRTAQALRSGPAQHHLEA